MTPVLELGRRAKAASRVLAGAPTPAKNGALLTAADLLSERAGEIRTANDADLEAARLAGMEAGPLDRLRLTEGRLAGMANGLRTLGVSVEETPDGAIVEGGIFSGGVAIEFLELFNSTACIGCFRR